MNEKVQAYLEAKRAESAACEAARITEQDREQALYRRRVLIKAGLFYKEYTDLTYKTEQYPNYDAQVGKYFAAVTYPVTDEQFEEIARYTPLDEPRPAANNTRTSVTGYAQVTRPNELADRIDDWARKIDGLRLVIIVLCVVGLLIGLIGAAAAESEAVALMVLLVGVPTTIIYNFLFKFFSTMVEAQASIVRSTKTTADAAVYALWKEETEK